MRIFSALRVRFKDVGELTKKYGNFPDSYLKRRMARVEYRPPRGFPQYSRVTRGRKDCYFGEHRPWSTEFLEDNDVTTRHRKVFVKPVKNWSFFKGDRVEILDGKDKGKQGIIAQVIQERNWVFVEGLNCEIKCQGKNKNHPGIYYLDERPLLINEQVALVDPSDLKATEIEWRFTEEGENVRVSKRTGRIIPLPVQAEETIDYKTRKTYVESPKDTKEEELLEVTFIPRLKTFEMEIMENMGIMEDRIPHPTYWY